MGLTVAWVAWAAWWFVAGREHVVLAVVDERGEPVGSATVLVGGDPVGTTSADGRVEVTARSDLASLEIAADGLSAAIPELVEVADNEYLVRVRSWILRGAVTGGDGGPVVGAAVSSGTVTARTGEDGGFLLRRARPGDLTVHRPGWETLDVDWDGSPGALSLTLAPQIVKAVHVTGPGLADRWADVLDLVEETELNGIMLDLKDETGTVWYATAVPLAADATTPAFDLAAVAADLEAAGVRLIGRIVTFQDPLAARVRPDVAVADPATGRPFTRNGQTFLDPTDPDARAYALDLAEEACGLGVDEVQFDYVRYPDGFGDAVFDGGSEAAVRRQAITSFLVEAGGRLHPHGCAVAADIFGFTTTAIDDGGIGQLWEEVTAVVDVVSPMLYPSHYDPGWYGFSRPIDHPGELADRALSDGMSRKAPSVVVRPWLQDFGYAPDDVRAQIDAAERHGLGWMLWNAAGDVSVDALEPAE